MAYASSRSVSTVILVLFKLPFWKFGLAIGLRQELHFGCIQVVSRSNWGANARVAPARDFDTLAIKIKFIVSRRQVNAVGIAVDAQGHRLVRLDESDVIKIQTQLFKRKTFVLNASHRRKSFLWLAELQATNNGGKLYISIPTVFIKAANKMSN